MNHDDLTEHREVSDIPEKEIGLQAEETQAFLDALALRTKGELDVDLAKSMQSVLGQAIRMVEAGTADVDKATPGGASSLPHYTNWVFDTKLQNHYLHGHTYDVTEINILHPYTVEETTTPGGAGDFLRHTENTIRHGASISHGDEIHVEPGMNPSESKGGDVLTTDSGGPEQEFSAARVLLAGGIPVATTVVGLLLLVGSAVTSPVRPNPYVALSILIAGIGLVLTAIAALRERRQDL